MEVNVINHTDLKISKQAITAEVMKHIEILNLSNSPIKSVEVLFADKCTDEHYPQNKAYAGFDYLHNENSNGVIKMVVSDQYLLNNDTINYIIAHEMFHVTQLFSGEVKVVNDSCHVVYEGKTYGVGGFRFKTQEQMATKEERKQYLFNHFPWEKDAVLYGERFGTY